MKKQIKTLVTKYKHIKNILMVLFAIVLIFVLIFFTAKNIFPDLLGSTGITNKEFVSISDSKLLGQKAPGFDLLDNTNNHVKLSSFMGTPVVILFWATWNGESADQIKILDDYISNRKIQNSLIKVITVDSLEDASIVKSFIRRGEYKISAGLDITGAVSNDYNVRSLPTAYFIGRDGIIEEIYTGILSEVMIVDKVDNLLK